MYVLLRKPMKQQIKLGLDDEPERKICVQFCRCDTCCMIDHPKIIASSCLRLKVNSILYCLELKRLNFSQEKRQ